MRFFSSLLSLGLTIPVFSQTTAPSKLNWNNIDEVENYIRLKPAEENYQKITWHTTVIAGQQKAQQEDKPLLLWLYFGDPRGNC